MLVPGSSSWWQHSQGDAIWVAGHALATVIMRMVMGWIYAFGGRSLFLAVVFHAMINTSLRLFPNDGSHYDPPVTAAVLAGMAVLMAVSLMITRRVLRAAA